MSNIDVNANRSAFFPKSKSTDIGRSSSISKSPYIKGNDAARKLELDQLTQRDAKVDINDAVRDFSKIKKAVDAAPEIDNSDKIARLKSQIQAGTYKIDYDALADKMLSAEF